MNLKILDSKSFLAEKSDGRAKLMVIFSDGHISFSVVTSEGTLEATTPGEFEKGGISLNSVETPIDNSNYLGLPNFLLVRCENIKCGVITDATILKHENLKGIEDVDLLIAPQMEMERVKAAVGFFEPSKLAILSKIGKDAFVTLSDLAKIFPFSEEVSSFKVKDSDFSQESPVQTKVYFIK